MTADKMKTYPYVPASDRREPRSGQRRFYLKALSASEFAAYSRLDDPEHASGMSDPEARQSLYDAVAGVLAGWQGVSGVAGLLDCNRENAESALTISEAWEIYGYGLLVNRLDEGDRKNSALPSLSAGAESVTAVKA